MELRKEPPVKKKTKDPPILVAERFRGTMEDESFEAQMYSTLDLSACLSTPMCIVYSRGRIRKWLAFDRCVIRGCKASIEYDGDDAIVVDSESGRSVTSTYRIGALEFTDSFSLNNVLMVRNVKRTMKRLTPRSPEEKKLTELLLLTWTGPHFASYCTAASTVGSRIDNRVIALPVLDFSFCQLKDVRDVLEKSPRDGKELREKHIYLHFLSYVDAQTKAAEVAAQRKREQEERSQSRTAKRDDIIIKAKNRIGDESHLVIDKNELFHSKASDSLDSRIELLEDAESVISDDRPRFVASGMKINNNELQSANELELVTRLIVMNAFYFLSWIDLASNQITCVPDLSPFPIVSLYLHDNKIQNVEDVQNLKSMKLLQNLTLFGNPIQSDQPAKYKLPVLNLLLVDDEAAINKQEAEKQRRRKEAGILKKAMQHIRATTPGGNIHVSAGRKTPSSAAAANSGNHDDDEDSLDAEGNLINKHHNDSQHRVVSPTRQKYFPDLSQARVPPPPPPPQTLKLKTFDHSLITPQDKKALFSYIELFIKKPDPKKRKAF